MCSSLAGTVRGYWTITNSTFFYSQKCPGLEDNYAFTPNLQILFYLIPTMPYKGGTAKSPIL